MSRGRARPRRERPHVVVGDVAGAGAPEQVLEQDQHGLRKAREVDALDASVSSRNKSTGPSAVSSRRSRPGEVAAHRCISPSDIEGRLPCSHGHGPRPGNRRRRRASTAAATASRGARSIIEPRCRRPRSRPCAGARARRRCVARVSSGTASRAASALGGGSHRGSPAWSGGLGRAAQIGSTIGTTSMPSRARITLIDRSATSSSPRDKRIRAAVDRPQTRRRRRLAGHGVLGPLPDGELPGSPRPLAAPRRRRRSRSPLAASSASSSSSRSASSRPAARP